MSQLQRVKNLANAKDIQEYFHEYNELFTELYNKLVFKLKDKLDDANNFIVFVAETMQLLTNEADLLHGYEKKQLVIDLVKSIVETMEISDEDKDTLKRCIFPTLDNTIDLFIAAAKGYLFFKKVEEKVEEECVKCSAKCSGFKCFQLKKTKQNRKNGSHAKPARNAVIATLSAPRTSEGAIDIGALSNVVYDNLRVMITHKQLTISSIMGIVTLTMQLVQQFASVDGSDKKKIVLNVINRIVDEFPMNPEDKLAIRAVIATTLDKTIDLVIGIANGDIDLIGMVEDGVAKCKTMCGCA